MNYNFNEIHDRSGTYSVKYNHGRINMPKENLPMWVADMDIKCPEFVIEALEDRVKHGIFGYSEPDDEYYNVVLDWLDRRHNWKPKKEWIVLTPGIVTAIHIAIAAVTKAGDGVLIQQPVYHPFTSAVNLTDRKLLVNELIYTDGKYSLDINDFEEKAKQAKLFILSNPHNPVGRVWTKEELSQMGDICLKYGVIVVSDEIHQDFIFTGHKHTVFTEVDEKYGDITITCTSASKTFNLAGLPLSNIFIPNENHREKFKHAYAAFGLSQLGIMGLVSCKAAYEFGDKWVDELAAYIHGNMNYIEEYCKEHLPEVKLVKPEGTYLAWLDFKGLNMESDVLNEFIKDKAKLWLDPGTKFGPSGEGFQRMNVACPRSTVEEAMKRLKAAISAL